MLIILAAALGLATGQQSAPIILDRPNVPRGAYILAGPEARKMFSQCSRGSPKRGDGEWMPDGNRIYELENALFDFLPKQQVDWRGKIFPSDYVRQYIGIVRGGHRYIYGNFIALPEKLRAELSLATKALVMCDGGSSAFGVEYDVERHTLAGFSVNGGF